MVLSLEEINVKMFNTALQASKLVQKLSNISYTELWSVPVIGFISREEISNEGVARVRYLLLRDMNPITGTDHSSV